MKSDLSNEATAARLFVESIAGESYVGKFPVQRLQDFFDRLECTYDSLPVTDASIIFLSVFSFRYLTRCSVF